MTETFFETEYSKIKFFKSCNTSKGSNEKHESFIKGATESNRCIYVYRCSDGFLLCFIGKWLKDCIEQKIIFINAKKIVYKSYMNKK